jgi:hypothetical protein
MPLDFFEGMPIPIRRDMPEPPPLVAVEPSPDGDNHPPRTEQEQQAADALFSDPQGAAAFFGTWAGAHLLGDWAREHQNRRDRDDEDEEEDEPQSAPPPRD